MLSEFRSTNITWDKATSRIYAPVTANESDENGRKLVVQVINSGQVENLTGTSLHLYWITTDKRHSGLDVFKAVDLTKGMFELSYTTGMLSNRGVLNANLVLVDTTGRVVSERFKITVTEGISDGSIQSENSFSSLTQALIEVGPRLNLLTAQLAQTNAQVDLLNRGLGETFSTLEALQTAYSAGDTKDHIVASDGHRYFWSGSAWTDGGVYQAMEVANGGIADRHISSITSRKITDERFIDLSKSYRLAVVDNAVITPTSVSYTERDRTVGNNGYTKLAIPFTQDQTISASVTITPPQGAVADNVFQFTVFAVKQGDLKWRIATRDLPPGTTQVSIPLDYDAIKATMDANAYTEIRILLWNKLPTIDAGTTVSLTNFKQTDSSGNVISQNVQDNTSRASRTLGDNSVNIAAVKAELENARGGYANIDARLDNIAYETAFTKIDTRSWFSDPTYTLVDGLYTIWWTAQNPGIKINIPNELVQSDHAEPMYIKFRARVIEGSGANALKFTAVTKNIKTVETLQYIDLTYDWQEYVIPFRFDVAPSDGVWDGVFALLQIITDSLSVKIQVDSPEIYVPIGKSVVKSLLNEVAYQEVNPEMRNSLLKGQLPKFDAAYITPVPVTGHHFVTPNEKVIADGQVIDKISYYAPLGAKTVTFTIGYIDQYNLLVAVDSFNVTSSVGYNEYVPSTPKSVPAGARLFMDISQFNVLYDSNDELQYIKHESVLIQEELTTFNEGGYSGMTFYESTHMIPFAYTVRAKTLNERMAEAEVALDLKADDIVPSTPIAVVRNPDGIKYSLMVDATGALKAVGHAPTKVFVMGNSLTLGFGTFGMAASDPDHDWYHYVEQTLLSYQPSLAMSRISASVWEGGVSSAERLAYLNTTVAPVCAVDNELIIIQLGDNVNTAEKQATFAADAITLVQWLRNRCPNARILWVNGWYNYNFCFPHIQTACDIRGAEVVDIRSLSTDSANKSAVGNQWTQDYVTYNTIVSGGVASHPGNTGMLKISQAIISVMDID